MQSFKPLITFEDEDKIPENSGIALAIGVFDGVHLGHRAIINAVCRIAEKRGAIPCAVTFEPHPRSVFGNAPELLVPFDERKRLLKKSGASHVGVINFSAGVASLAPEKFLDLLVNDRRFHLEGISVGEHWRFGYRGAGGRELIADYAGKYGFDFTAVPELLDGSNTISSSLIRSLVSKGDIKRAAAMLGRNPFLFGTVEKGFGIAGTKLDAPTANLRVSCGVMVPDGVYAAKVHLDGNVFAAAVNVGTAPTFGVNQRRVEIHLLDWQGNLYGRYLALELVEFLRREKRFDSWCELKEQISSDVSKIREILKSEK